MKISVIIPVLNESKNINTTLDNLRGIGGDEVEIIVVDGGPGCGTLAAMRNGHQSVCRIASAKGRGIQMNVGASAATGDVLLFLHADTVLPPGSFNDMRRLLRDPSIVGGAFELKLDAPGLFFKVISSTASLRSKVTKIPLGDQAIFMRKNYFDSIGGFETIPLMEDTELMTRVKSLGGRIGIVNKQVVSSARMWQQNGVFRTTLKNHAIRLLYTLGVSPARLVKIYDIDCR
jgi:rSAM/selenodomain-associated transferase 2